MPTISDASHRSGIADHIFCPQSEREIQEIIIEMVESDTPLTVVGGKTGLAGACSPMYGGIAMEMSKMLFVEGRERYTTHNVTDSETGTNFQYLIDQKTNTGIFPPGITLEEMDRALETHNLFFASKPGYMKGQLGGAVATNASGPRTFSYGATRDAVLGLHICLPNGDLARLKRGEHSIENGSFSIGEFEIQAPMYDLPIEKNMCGFYSSPDMDLIDLFIGSEGVLGVVTEIEVQLYERKETETQMIFFSSEKDLKICGFALSELRLDLSNIRNGGIFSLEYIDPVALGLVEDLLIKNGITDKNLCALEIEYWTDDGTTKVKIETLCEAYNALPTKLSGQAVMQMRYTIPQRVNGIMAERGMIKVASDFSVPDEHFPQMIEHYIFATRQMQLVNDGDGPAAALWGHFGNSHLHWNAMPDSQSAFETAQEIYIDLAQKAIDLGGTVTAEHGTGKKKIGDQLMLEMLSPEMFEYAKYLINELNPRFLLNRGNMIGYKK